MTRHATEDATNRPLGPDGFTGVDGLPRVPIVLGVVGHRKGDMTGLKDRLVDLFQSFRRAYPDSPLIVLSSLAQGADQVAARAAIDAGAFVRAPLPFDKADYRASTSFDADDVGEEARKNLDDLLDETKEGNAKIEWFAVPLPSGDDVKDRRWLPTGIDLETIDWKTVATEPGDGPNAQLRRVCYATAGGYMVRHCHALVAIWDGEAGKTSGTGEHVAFKLHGRAPKLYPWTDHEPLGFRGDRGLVIHVAMSRTTGEEATKGKELPVRVLVPSEGGEIWEAPPEERLAMRIKLLEQLKTRWKRALGGLLGHHPHVEYAAMGEEERREYRHKHIEAEIRSFRDSLTAVDDFNREIGHPEVAPQVRKAVAKEEKSLFVAEMPDRERQALQRLVRLRGAASTISRIHQPRVDRMTTIVFGLVFFSLLFFHLYAHAEGPAHAPWLLWLFLALLFIAVASVACVWVRRWEERRLDGRGLAEALRVRKYWAMAGIGTSVADSYLGQVRGEAGWMRLALHHCCPPSIWWADAFRNLSRPSQETLVWRVRKEWITDDKEGQLPYLRRKHKENHRWAAAFRQGFWLAFVGWFVLALLAASGVVGLPLGRFSPVHPHEYVLIVPSLMVIAGGLCLAYGERRAFEEQAHQYDRLRLVFENANHELSARLDRPDPADPRRLLPDIAGARRVLEALGREAVVEHSQWLILRRSRSLEMPLGG